MVVVSGTKYSCFPFYDSILHLSSEMYEIIFKNFENFRNQAPNKKSMS